MFFPSRIHCFRATVPALTTYRHIKRKGSYMGLSFKHYLNLLKSRTAYKPWRHDRERSPGHMEISFSHAGDDGRLGSDNVAVPPRSPLGLSSGRSDVPVQPVEGLAIRGDPVTMPPTRLPIHQNKPFTREMSPDSHVGAWYQEKAVKPPRHMNSQTPAAPPRPFERVGGSNERRSSVDEQFMASNYSRPRRDGVEGPPKHHSMLDFLERETVEHEENRPQPHERSNGPSPFASQQDFEAAFQPRELFPVHGDLTTRQSDPKTQRPFKHHDRPEANHRNGTNNNNNNNSAALDAIDDREGRDSSSIMMKQQNEQNGAVATIATIPLGGSLNADIEEAVTYPVDPRSSQPTMPSILQASYMKSQNKRDRIPLPSHLNSLFHKIMGWSKGIVELDQRKDLLVDRATAQTMEGDEAQEISAEHRPMTAKDLNTLPSTEAQKLLQPQLKKKMLSALKGRYGAFNEKVKYGVLMAEFEDDRFALENKLVLAGTKFEKKFGEWEGRELIQDPEHASRLQGVIEGKTSLILHPGTHSSFQVPVMGRDPCPGCGAIMQEADPDAFGYCNKGSAEKYIISHQQAMKNRAEYAARMSELQTHWEKNGRRVGEEWLDFMTQEEFNAIYRYVERPMLCQRCYVLSRRGSKTVPMAAPDFAEELKQLRNLKCLIVLVVDVFDFPGSMVQDLPGLISMNNPVLIVLNKCDTINPRNWSYLDKPQANKFFSQRIVTQAHLKKWAWDVAVSQFRLPAHVICDIIPFSAKKKWNVELLVSRLEHFTNLDFHNFSAPRPAYFVGVCNVGKSSVLNAIAEHLSERKPPHPNAKRVFFTEVDRKTGEERVIAKWHIPARRLNALDHVHSRSMQHKNELFTVSSLPGTTVRVTGVMVRPNVAAAKREDSDVDGAPLSPKQDQLEKSKKHEHTEMKTWFYDTPGLYPLWMSESILTVKQVRQCLARDYRNPQMFIAVEGTTLFFSGLAAIDVLQAPKTGILFLCYASKFVMKAVVRTEASDDFWAKNLGSRVYPPGSLEQIGDKRLVQMKKYLFECFPRHAKKPKADIYVCGIGWVSFFVQTTADVVLQVRTLPGVFHGVREPLRPKDLRVFKGWPKLQSPEANALARNARSRPIDTIVELTDVPYDPNAPPLQQVAKEMLLSTVAAPQGSAKPLEEFEEELLNISNKVKKQEDDDDGDGSPTEEQEDVDSTRATRFKTTVV